MDPSTAGSHQARQPNGKLHPVSLYPCKDGLVYLTVVPTFWRSLVSMLGRDDLLKDKRFSTNTARLKNVDALDEIITEVFSRYTMAECLELGQRKHRIPIGAAMTLDQVLTDEHLKARHYWQEVVIPGRGTHRMPGSAFRDVPPTPQQQLRYDEPKSVQNAGIPAGAVMTAPEFMSDPHVLARDYFVELGGEDIEPILYPGSPVRFDGIRASELQRAPRLGEHNEVVLGDVLGLTDEEIGRLRDEGVIADMPPTIEEARR